jgi:hypothetical protein
MPDSAARRAVAHPALVVEDNPSRGKEVEAELLALGLTARVVPTSSFYAVPGPSDQYSLAVLSVRSLQPADLADAAAIRKSKPELPLILLCEAKTPPGVSPWPACTVTSTSAIAQKLRIHASTLLGISLSDEPGATLKS